MNEQNNLEILGILTIVSFILQMQNQSKIFGISDVQDELHKAVKEIHAHLEIQDEKLNKILGVLGNEIN
jgi:hypothetical protein